MSSFGDSQKLNEIAKLVSEFMEKSTYKRDAVKEIFEAVAHGLPDFEKENG